MARVAKIKGKYYDINPKNKSFLQLACDLQKIGVKNYYFMLEIMDLNLLNVDPFAVDEHGQVALTQEQIGRIITEIICNPWYYLREVCRMPSAGSTGSPYLANRGNIAQAWCIFHGIDSWACLLRQIGKTESAIAALTWGYSFGTMQSKFIFIHKDGDGAKGNLARMTTQISLLPKYLRFDSFTNEDGKIIKAKNNATFIAQPITHNTVVTKSKAVNIEAAMSLARGMTAAVLYFDEPEFTPFIDVIVSNSVSTYMTAAEYAEKSHGLHARVFTCTPGDADSKPAQAAQRILEHSTKWDDHMYDMTKEEIREAMYSLDKHANEILYIEFPYYMMGRSEEWVQMMYNKMNDPVGFRREILLQRIHGSDAFPYGHEVLEVINNHMKNPIDHITLLKYYIIDVYEKLDPKIPYVMGVDCSTGTTSDANAITIINPYNMKPAAEFSCNYIGETKYRRLITEIVQRLLPMAIVVIERNHVGDSIIDGILDEGLIAHRLYFDKSKELINETLMDASDITSMLKKEALSKTYYGVYTQQKSREEMFTILARRVAENPEDFVTQNITKDIRNLVKLKGSDKIAAAPGEHDDSIMSYLIAMYAIYYGNNLPFFGLIPGTREEREENSGMLRASDADPTLLNENAYQAALKDEELERSRKAEAMREYRELMESQKESFILQQKGLIDSYDIDHTPGLYIDQSDSGTSSGRVISLDFFDEL